MAVHPIIKQQFRNSIFIVFSFLLYIKFEFEIIFLTKWMHIFKFANTFSQIFLQISHLFFFFLCVSNSIVINSSNETIRKKSIQDPADFHEKQNSSRWTVFTERSAVIMRSDRWNFPNRSANSPRVWLHFARRSVEGRRIIRSSVHASCCTSWGCTATVWRACAKPKFAIFDDGGCNAFPTNSIFRSFGFSNYPVFIYPIWIGHIYIEKSRSRKFLSMCVWSHYKRCFVSFVIDFTQFVFLMD